MVINSISKKFDKCFKTPYNFQPKSKKEFLIKYFYMIFRKTTMHGLWHLTEYNRHPLEL